MKALPNPGYTNVMFRYLCLETATERENVNFSIHKGLAADTGKQQYAFQMTRKCPDSLPELKHNKRRHPVVLSPSTARSADLSDTMTLLL